MYAESAHLYDKIYGQLKDYPAEVQKIQLVIEREYPAAQSLLDVGCGTAEHARLLQCQFGYAVDGLDLDEAFVALARSKNPQGHFFCGDMADFHLAKTYDVVMCLFSSIGYLMTLPRVTQALACFKAHLNPGGIILVEPWFQPDHYTPGRVFTSTVESDDMSLVRMATSQVEQGVSTLRFDYLIGQQGTIEHKSETHQLGLWTEREMRQCFAAAGLQADYEAQGLSGRGLYVARET